MILDYWFYKNMKLFKGRVSRKNFLGGILLIGLFFGIVNIGLSFVNQKVTENAYKSSSIINDYMVQKADKMLSIEPEKEVNINKEELNKELNNIASIGRVFAIVQTIILIIVILLSTSLSFRRFHDFNVPGFWSFISCVTLINRYLIIVNFLLILFLLFKKGDIVANKYGEVDTGKDLIKLFI